MAHAGFFRRGAALLIDLVAIPIVWFAAFLGAAIIGGLLAGLVGTSDSTDDRLFDRLFGPLAVTLLVAVPLLYSAVLEAAAGGTVGKLLVGIRVERAEGGKVGFFRALLRAIVKVPATAFFGLGLLPAALTERHQGLHDLLADTVVLRGRRGSDEARERVLGGPGEHAETPVMVREG